MALYDEDILDADMELRENGEIVMVTLAAGAVEDEDQPWKETDAGEQEWDDVPVLYDQDRSSPFRAYIKGTDIPEGAALCYMSAAIPFTPTQKHVIHSPSRGRLTIDVVDVISPGSQVILYVLRLSQ